MNTSNFRVFPIDYSNNSLIELEQSEELGVDFTQGSVEDTDELEQLLNKIIEEFKQVVVSVSSVPLNQQKELRSLLEVTIDNQFREAINSAVSHQSWVAAALTRLIPLWCGLLWALEPFFYR